MGNCGSAINCAQCYGEEEGCLREIKVDPDIAGIGVSSLDPKKKPSTDEGT